ncbi:hypothetical protein Emin_0241 [Elusimicrobium minutum Pei191]|uniref:Uncharacterized protein n=1 Tax=Elusimicrobium minutum (strain Pei191) TaxID=445932 RepID=B2KB44_ELUMP|nr:hypothetical protein [Elusimicrobium minutum]ACC97803.1 hypothetical protein Emin_0241 [Elusimicrobium minutum Pei191]
MKIKKIKPIIKTETNIEFKYKLEGFGCSKAYLKIGDTKVIFPSISYLCFPITDLLEGLLSIIAEWDIISKQGKNTKITNDDSVFIWEDEPGGYAWSLERHRRRNLRIIIKSLYEDESGKEKYNKIVLDKIVNFKAFLAVILTQIDAIVKEYGLLGFRGNWATNTQFPLSQFLELKYYLLYNKILYISKEGKTKNWSLKKELQLLNTEIL